ncbi:hypothetical protein J6590_003766 [Homalodisca vitripennis]|nr:hypothetical protein J6590_003766 [Homalodisca vitripennis]
MSAVAERTCSVYVPGGWEGVICRSIDGPGVSPNPSGHSRFIHGSERQAGPAEGWDNRRDCNMETVLVTVLVILVVTSLVNGSRLPLIVFQQHHHLFHRLEDMFDDLALQTTVSPEYHAYRTVAESDYRPLRILYQVGEVQSTQPALADLRSDTLYGYSAACHGSSFFLQMGIKSSAANMDLNLIHRATSG